jgi:hypothetical protein
LVRNSRSKKITSIWEWIEAEGIYKIARSVLLYISVRAWRTRRKTAPLPGIYEIPAGGASGGQKEKIYNSTFKNNETSNARCVLKTSSWLSGCMVAAFPARGAVFPSGIEAKGRQAEEQLKEYCMKSKTREEGPWSSENLYFGSDLTVLTKNPYPWQKEVINWFEGGENFGDREIRWIYDPFGNTGKSKVDKYLCYHLQLRGFTRPTDVGITKAFSQKVYAGISIDLSRTRAHNYSMDDLYSSLESARGGTIRSDSYYGGQVFTAPPACFPSSPLHVSPLPCIP